ncbi:MAG: hypothetical protein FWF90_17835 [Promicromonosporaceae bacterium]|nr:hypothetical protein [Promicromonosporaceae bacterium]
MSIDMPREMKIAADELAAHDHLADPATRTHQIVAAQIWRTFKALGNQGGHVLTIGDGCGTLIGLPDRDTRRHGSVIARVDRHDNAVGPISDMQRWDEREDFDAVLATLTGYDVRLTYPPNIVRRRADQITDTLLAVAVTKPGGFTAVVATHDLMDNPMPFGRRQIGDLADLVGAIRFPAGIYRPATGTDEVTDLLMLRRRESGAARRGAEWEEATPVELDRGHVYVNTYFDTAVDQVLGSTQYDPTGHAPTNLTVVGSRHLFPGLLTTATNNVIAYGQRVGLTTPAGAPRVQSAASLKPSIERSRQHRGGLDGP